MMSAFSKGFFYGPKTVQLINYSGSWILKGIPHQRQGIIFVFGGKVRAFGQRRGDYDDNTQDRVKNRSLATKSPSESSRLSLKQQGPLISSPVISPYQNYLTTLAQKSHSTLLYTAPSSAAYIISSYTSAAFCFSYGIISYWNNYLCAPPDIAVWVPYAFSGVSLAMVFFGIRFLRNPVGMIQRMTAFPRSFNSKPTLEIKIELKRMTALPFFHSRIISVAPHEIIIPTPMARPIHSRITQSDLRRHKVEEALRRQKDLEYEQSHVMSAGLRHMGRALSKMFTSIFRAVQRSFTRENFFEMRIRGKIYQLDLDGGWLLDNGKSIDRLVTLEPYAHSGLVSKLTR